MRLLMAFLLCLPLLAQAEPRVLDWLELLPDEDLQALIDMPEIGHDWGEEAPGDFSQSLRQRDKTLPEVMYSTRVVPGMDGLHARLAGFPVPLESNEHGLYTRFFLVPSGCACIHLPPPPPNQSVLVDYPAGFAITDLYQPIWIEGTLQVDQTSNELADASYSLNAGRVWIYDGE